MAPKWEPKRRVINSLDAVQHLDINYNRRNLSKHFINFIYLFILLIYRFH